VANVQLPNIGHTNSDIDGASFSQLQTIVKSLMNTTAMLTEELTYLLNNLDTRNVNELNAEVITAGSVTADKITVTELSALSANMGKLTSGEIFGAYIATRENAYPRAELSNEEDLFAAYLDANNYIKVEANYGGVPSLNFIQGGAFKARMDTLLGYLEIRSLTSLLIQATLDVEIATGASSILKLPPFGRVESSTGQNLGVELDSKAKAGISTGPSGGHNHAIPPGTRLLVEGGGYVTWSPVSDHTHAQNG